jgi:hypothetical protein
MVTRVGINGFGRIGRAFTRLAEERGDLRVRLPAYPGLRDAGQGVRLVRQRVGLHLPPRRPRRPRGQPTLSETIDRPSQQVRGHARRLPGDRGPVVPDCGYMNMWSPQERPSKERERGNAWNRCGHRWLTQL